MPVDFAVGLLDVVTEVLADVPLQVDFVFYALFVKPVVQAACIGLGTLRRRAGGYLGTGFFRRQPGLPNLARFVGDLEVSRVDAAAGNAFLPVAVAAVANTVAGAVFTGSVAQAVFVVRLCVAFLTLCFVAAADTGIHPQAFALVAAVVVQVAKAEGAGAKVVLAVVFCALAGGDKAAVELGMGSDMDLIAVVAGIEAALFANAPVVGIQLALAVMAVDAYAAVAGADLGAAALLPALVGGGVLYAFDGEVLYIGLNAFAGDLGASEGGVAAALEDGLAVFVADVAVAVVTARVISALILAASQFGGELWCGFS